MEERHMAELNLKIGDYVHYGAHGVCRICEREARAFGCSGKDYFLLKPVSDERIQLYLPVDAEPDKVKLRQVLSAEDIYCLVDEEQESKVSWIVDSKLRREVGNETLRSGDTIRLMRMLKAIHAHEQNLPSGKNLPMSDLELMRSAEKQLYNEFCFVLDIRKEQVLPFILGECRVAAKKPTAS
jgi:CarD family transcriptional regulator